MPTRKEFLHASATSLLEFGMHRFRQLQPWITCVLIGYWIGMVIGTHLPKIPKPLDTSLPDKTLHYLAFAGLGFLLSARRGAIAALRWRDAVIVLATLATYGIFDELTQIPVGRTADVYDWFADLIGGTSGLLVFMAADYAWRRVFQSAEHSPSRNAA